MKPAKTINIIGGTIFCLAPFFTIFHLEGYFQSIYGAVLETSGSKTVLRTICLVLSTVGAIYIYLY